MREVVIASGQEDAATAERVKQHHAEMAGTLSLLVERSITSARSGAGDGAAAHELVQWCHRELLPHAAAEESTLYAAARDFDSMRPLVDAMIKEHSAIGELVREVAAAPDPIAAAAAARALQAVFDAHLGKENDFVLPVLASSADHSVTAMLAGMHEILGAHEPDGGDSRCAGHGCGCRDAEHDPSTDGPAT